MKPDYLLFTAKKYVTAFFVLFFFSFGSLFAQTTCLTPTLVSGFEVDGDVTANTLSPVNGDSWFVLPGNPGTGIGVIGTTAATATPAISASQFKSIIQAASGSVGRNRTYVQRMSVPNLTAMGGWLLIDAFGVRDNISTGSAVDSTVFTAGGQKNGDNPTVWNIGTGGVQTKNDIIDVTGHLRRQTSARVTSTSPLDLWMYASITTLGTSGDRYSDIELFRTQPYIDQSTGHFVNTGPAATGGHTAFVFDNTGSVASPGDLLISINYSISSGLSSLRIWCNINNLDGNGNGITWFNAQPNRPYDLTGDFITGTNSNGYGYAEIASLNGASCLVYSILNNTNIPAGAWGNLSGSSANYDANIQSQQLVNVAINLTDFGLDNATVSGPCFNIFGSILIKTRSSSSYSSELKDFIGPLTFANFSEVNSNAGPDMFITCDSPAPTLQGSSLTPGATFSWTTPNGNIVSGASTAHPVVNAPGTYILAVQNPTYSTCISYDTVIVANNLTPPGANAGPDKSLTCTSLTTNLIGSSTTPGVTYSWSAINGGSIVGSTTTATPVVNAAGCYILTVTNPANGCTRRDTACVTLNNSVPVISGSTQINVSCYAGCNGSASFTVTGGQSPFTYNWSNGATSPSATGLCAGTYTVTVTGSNGCSATSTFNITQPSQNLAVSISSTQPVSCLGGSNGAAIVAANGGTAPYTYNWNTGATTASVSGLTAGSYTATVTDANGCTASGATTVTQPATAVTATLVVLQQVGCYGGSNGSLDLSPAGGSPPYTYQWSNGAWSQDVSGLGAGTYTVTVTDGNGCSAVQSAVITQPAAALSATTSMTQSVACFGGNSGTASVAVSGGTVPYSYMWNTGATTQNISSLAAGTYTVTVTDANGCTTVKSVSITQPVAALTTNLTSSQPVSCFGGANGSINLSVSGGTTPYTYAWSNGATTQDISNISASTYTITVTDARGCTATRSVTITQPAAAVAVSITATPNVSCFGGTNGAATATVTGGTAPYLYQWNTGATTQILSGLIAGLYTVTITDANSCATSGQITITQPAAALVNSLSVTQTVACFGGNNGSINNTVSGGTAPYTYNWSNGASTQNISGLSAGTYTVTVTDSKGCTTVKAVTVTQPSGALTGSITSTTNVSCFGGVNGAVDLTVSGGTGPFTYAWSNGATTQDLTGTASGTYTVTITDSRGCTTTKTATIIQPAASLSASIASSVNISCFGGTNGSVTTTISGGTSPYSYNWSNGSTTQNLTGLGSGTYTVTVTDINGCTATVSANLSQPAASLSTSYSVTSNVSCFGGSNGAIDLSVNGGTPAYTYNWSNGAVSEDLTGVASGNYTVTVTDANGCTSVKTVSISQPAASLSGTAVQNPPVSCFGGSDGAANLAVSGGTGPYTYLWSNGSTLQSILNLSSGTYTVTITDANGCTANASVNITQPSAALTSSTTTTSNISCFAGNNGSVDLTVNGGTMPYAFNWSNGAITEDLSGLPAGSYSVIVTDVNGCTTTAAASITQPPGSLGANIAITQQVACYGGGNGAIDLTVSGGTSPYTINWSNGAVTEDLSGLAVGVYTVNISDANGCITSATAAITQPLAPLSSTLNVLSNVNCFAGTDGTLDLSVSGGSVPYTYLWSSGNVTQDLYNVAAGTYTVTVTDVNGCTLQQSATVTQPAAALTSSITSQTNVLCFGGLNGAIDLTISGGTTPYVYNWSNGANSEDISGLSGGTYTVMVTDANGCNTSISATLSEPAAALNTSISSQLMVACYGDASGSATLNTSGGTVPYTYSWSNGAVSATLSNVGSNSYQVTVTDANGCTAVASVTLSQPAAALSTAISVSQNVSCYSGADGSANLTVNGGTQPYTYLWSNGFVSQNLQNVIAGNYTVTVTDANGCTSQQSVVISEPSATVTGNAAVTSNVNCFGGSNGAIDVTINGGTLPYLYQWNNGSSTEDLSGLDAGTYTVTVTDLNGCSVELTSIITEPSAALNGVLTVSQNVLCYSDSTGMLDLTVTGGTTPYTFNWNTGATSEDLSGLVTGTYTVSVTDANGCTTELTTFIDEPRSALSVTATTVLPVLCNGGSDGGIDVSVSGGTPSYSFSWNNGASTEDLANLQAGIYTLVVTDINGCSDSITVNITEPMAALTTALTVTQQVNCFAGEDGAIDLTVTGGTVPYTYLWSNTQTTEDMNQLMAGTYTVTVTDLNGCSAEGQIDILEPSQPLTGTANILSNVFCNGGSNGSIDLVMNGGTAPYVYLWSTGETTEDISGLSSGIYSVTVTDANGCTFTTSGGIGQPSQQLSASMNIQNVLCFSGTNGFIDLNVTGGTAPYTFNWSNGSNTEDLGALGSGTYTVTIIDANGCDTTLTGTVDQPTAPLIPAVAVDQNVSCYAGSNGSLSLTVTGGTLPYTYLWNTGSTTSAISNLPAGMYTLTVTDANGCNAIIAQTVTQPNAPLNAPLVVTQNVSCFSGNDGSILANAIGGTSPYTYLWNTGASGNSISNLTSGIYTVTVTDTLGCVFTDSIEVTQPAAALSLTGSTTLADCLYGIGGSATVSATGGTAPYSYNWNTGASTNNIGNAAPGAYTVTVTDANGCSDILNLNVGNQSTISIYPGPVEICSGQTALLEVDSIPGATYQWYYGGAPLLGAVTNSFQTPAQGYYYVTVTTPCGIFTSDSVTVTVHSMNGVTISSNQVICPPESVQLIATGGTSYQWSPATNINFTNVANPSVSPTASTLYSVVISDAYGCTAQLSVNVTVDCDSLFIPNGFSPNEDGINDGYVIDGILDYPNNKIWIYNRWGNLIYKTKGYANQWDGTCNVQGIYFGTKVPSGTYFYILELGVPSEKPRAGYLIIRH